MDGLRKNRQSGVSYKVYCHNTELLTEAWPLGSYSTVFQAKLDAIGKLRVDLCKWDITNTEVILHCDLIATIMS